MKNLAFIFILSIVAGMLRAQATNPIPTAPAQSLIATIVAVEGMVQVRSAEDQPWQPAQVGMKLNQGAEFRTGLRSAVRFTIPPDQTITLDRLGTIKVLQAIQEQGKVTTDLGLKYGRARYDIQKAGADHASTIRSPGSTLAIRGTDVLYEDQAPWVPSSTSLEGRAQYRDNYNQYIAFGYDTPIDMSADSTSPAETSIRKTKNDPKTDFSGRPPVDQNLLIQLPSYGGFDGREIQVLQQQARAIGQRHPTPAPGPLSFLLTWQSLNVNAPGATDLDLAVTDPLGRVVSSAHPTAGSGSVVATFSGNNRGVNGSGSESVTWSRQFFPGTYSLGVRDVSGDPASLVISVTRQGSVIKSFGPDPANPLILSPGQSFNTTVEVPANNSGAVGARPAPRGKRP